MDGYSLFRQLGAGAKFDFKRFHKDAERLKLVKPEESQEHCDSTDGKEEKWKDRDFIDEENVQSHAEQEGKKEKAGVKKKSLSAKKKADLHQEKVNHIRKKKKIHVYGSDIPDPVVSFDQLHTEYMVHQKILENTKNVGYETPTPIQMQAIPVMIQHREILACAPTGSGKTAAFIIPILHHLKEPRNCGIRAVVISPTRELSKQTFREFYRLSEGQGFRIHYIHKATLKKYKPNSLKKIDILVTTPNRLTFLLKREPQVLSLSRVEWLVVDESDKLFEAGRRGFRDQLAVVYKACDSPDICRAMFSATFAYDVEEWCKLNLDNVVQVYIGGKNLAAETVSQELLFVGTEAGKLLAVRDIVRKGIEPPVLIFVQSKERAKELFHELIYDGINVDVIHADRTQQQRDNTIKSFREGKIWILICTELLGRGIDFKGVNLVINFDFPNSAISYIHRIGRTGRAGQTGKAVTFFVEDDSANLRSIANVMKEAGCLVPEYMLKMKKATSKQRKKLAGTTLKRKNISTTLLPDKRKKLRKVIEKKKKTDQTPAAATLPCESSTTPSPLASHLDSSKNEM